MVQRIPRQQETDLAFVRRLAERNGFVFYVEPATFGVNRAYWGPEIRTTAPQSALTMNMGARTNVERLSFSNDALAPVGTSGTFVDPIFKLPIPIPQLPSLRIPPLSSSPAPTLRTVQLRESANESAATAATAAVAAVTRAPEAVGGARARSTPSATANVLRGAEARRACAAPGTSYDGFYYVRKVTHTLRAGRVHAELHAQPRGNGRAPARGGAVSYGNRFYGKYRGIVQDNEDPLMQGRIQATVPGRAGRRRERAGRCPARRSPAIGSGFFALPPVGAGVWIEFEHGDPDYPIWIGLLGGARPPSCRRRLLAPPYQKVMLKTTAATASRSTTRPASAASRSRRRPGRRSSLTRDRDRDRQRAWAATIELHGPQVSINDGALEVI